MSDMYRIIAYKPDRVDYRRGCAINRWRSELENVTVEGMGAAIEQIADFMARGFGDENIIITFALPEEDRNGLWIDNDEMYYSPARLIANRLREEAEKVQKELEEKKLQEQQRVARESTEKRERAELERLKAKYGD